MNATLEPTFTGLFDQAVHGFGDALKAGVKFQNDLTKFWVDAIEGANTVAPVIPGMPRFPVATAKEYIPVAEKGVEDLLKVVEASYKKSLELMKKVFEAKDEVTAADVQVRIQKLWEGTVEIVRENAEGVTQTNVKLIENFAEILRKGLTAAFPPVKGFEVR